ncbi:Gfo/Idh/MocA family protein [Fulvivirga lutimaris]|uniref:Gfo/Idh/MocA family protein n=1 Tax=Fulvivirga lutimaris TaxID=1819566 RepID=UPI001629AFF7|nr:Gfo/Idh/MocA family oxidoreductase [Fulvivirga lutimaris]
MIKGMLKMGMVGGGPGAMIGDIHRLTAQATGKAKLVCGAFSSDHQKSQQKGKELGLDASRAYGSVEEMIEGELSLPEKERMDFLAITTPNHLHVAAAKLALQSGFHVMCDKPLSINYQEAIDLKQIVDSSNYQFGMTYTYRGYAGVLKIKELIESGKIGDIRKIKVDYTQGWLNELIENDGQKQAKWRTDPKFSGLGGTIADIGTHAFNMAEYLVGAKVAELVADVSILVEGRRIDDDANVLLRYENGVKATLSVGQACAGEQNSFNVKVYGSKGGLHWTNESPKVIAFKSQDSLEEIKIDEFDVDLTEAARLLPDGHDISFLKGFVTLYDRFLDSIQSNSKANMPDIEDGVRGMLFIEKAIESSKNNTYVKL